MEKNKWKKIVYYSLQLIIVVGILITVKALYTREKQCLKSRLLYVSLQRGLKGTEQGGHNVSEKNVASELLEEQKGMNSTERERETISEIAFLRTLKNKNEDTIGWIEISGTSIAYPIMQSKDNNYYLTHDFNKAYSATGSIFMDSGNDSDFKDANTILYGHNMKDGSMFHDLHLLRQEEYLKEHLIINVITDQGVQKYKIFSIYVAKASADYRRSYKIAEEQVGFLERVQNRSLVVLDKQKFEGTETILTLSTCAYDFNNARLVVHAKKIKS